MLQDHGRQEKRYQVPEEITFFRSSSQCKSQFRKVTGRAGRHVDETKNIYKPNVMLGFFIRVLLLNS